MKTTAMNTLVLGATGSIGHAVTANLMALKLPVTIMVRKQAKPCLPASQRLPMLRAMLQDAALVNRLVADRDYIFHGMNYPYNKWFGNMDSVAIRMSSKSLILLGMLALMQKLQGSGQFASGPRGRPRLFLY